MSGLCFGGSKYKSICFDGSRYACDTTGANSVCHDGSSYIDCPAPNNPPVADLNFSDDSHVEGTAQSYQIAPCFTDADGDTLTYNVVSPSTLPSGVTFDSNTGILSFDATVAVGTYSFVINANDGTDNSNPDCEFDIEVTQATASYSFDSSIITGVQDLRGTSTHQGDDGRAHIFVGALPWSDPAFSEPAYSTSGVDTGVSRSGSPDIGPFGPLNPVGAYVTSVNVPADVTHIRLEVLSAYEESPTGSTNNNPTIQTSSTTSGHALFKSGGGTYTGAWIAWAAGLRLTAEVAVLDTEGVGGPYIRTMQVRVSFRFTDNTELSQIVDISVSAWEAGGGPIL